jgi:hypothetical protein
MSKNWGYVLTGAGRPERDLQRRVMALAGVDLGEYGACWEDKLPPRATRPRSALVQREYLLQELAADDVVTVAALLCLGASPTDAEWFIHELWKRGARAVVHDGALVLEPNADLSEVLANFERARKALHVRRSRAKARKPKRVQMGESDE